MLTTSFAIGLAEEEVYAPIWQCKKHARDGNVGRFNSCRVDQKAIMA